MAVRRITKQVVDSSLADGRDFFIWDSDVKGFGLKISPSAKKTYIVEYRTSGGRAGRKRRFTIGRHGSPWTAEAARDEAWKLLGRVAHGEDPALYGQAVA